MRYRSRPVPEDLNTTDGRGLLREVMETLERLTEGTGSGESGDLPDESTPDGGLAFPQGLATLGIAKAGAFFTPVTTGGTVTFIPPEPRNTIRSFTFPVGTTVTTGGNIKISPDFVSTMPTDTLTLQCDGDIWFEIARSVFSTSLPPGTLAGQSLYWTGSAWAPNSQLLQVPGSTYAKAKTRFTVEHDDDEAFQVMDSLFTVFLWVDTNNGIVYCINGRFIVGSILEIAGGYQVTIKNISADTTLADDEYVTEVDTSTLAITVELPPSPTAGQMHVIGDTTGNAAANNVYVDGNGNQVEGQPGVYITTNYGYVRVMWNGTEWVQR